MKIIITSATGIKQEVLLHKESGIIEFPNGELSHVLFEKQFGKSITILKEVKPEVLMPDSSSVEQSEPRLEKKNKKK
jgi:hypothetical protein